MFDKKERWETTLMQYLELSYTDSETNIEANRHDSRIIKQTLFINFLIS